MYQNNPELLVGNFRPGRTCFIFHTEKLLFALRHIWHRCKSQERETLIKDAKRTNGTAESCGQRERKYLKHGKISLLGHSRNRVFFESTVPVNSTW